MRVRRNAKLWLGALALIGLGFLLAAVVFIFLAPAAEEAPLGSVTATARGGWYTQAQAERGHEDYDQHCARCHGIDLAGLGPNPPLVGAAFMQRWEGESVGRLFHYTRTTMPLDNPRSLSDDSYLRIIAHILQANGFPPGERELPQDSDQLGQLVITAEEVE